MTTSCSSTCAVSDRRMPCLISCLPGVRPGVLRSTTKKVGPSGRLREDRVEVGDRPVRDELLHAVQPVVRDAAVGVGDALGRGLEALHVRPGLGLGHAVGDDQPFVGDARQPLRLLLVACSRRGSGRCRARRRASPWPGRGRSSRTRTTGGTRRTRRRPCRRTRRAGTPGAGRPRGRASPARRPRGRRPRRPTSAACRAAPRGRRIPSAS